MLFTINLTYMYYSIELTVKGHPFSGRLPPTPGFNPKKANTAKNNKVTHSMT